MFPHLHPLRQSIERQPLLLPTLATVCAILGVHYRTYICFASGFWALALLCLLPACAYRHYRVAMLCLCCAAAAALSHLRTSSALQQDQHHLAGHAHPATLTASVLSAEPAGNDWISYHLMLKSSTLPLANPKICLLYPKDSPLSIGTTYRISGRLTLPARATNPDTYDARKLLWHEGIATLCQADTITPSSDPPRFWLRRAAHASEVWLSRALTHGVSDPTARKVLLAVFLGKKPQHSDELLTHFRLSGTLHVFAVSGLHVVMLGSFFALLFRLFAAPRKVWLPVTLLAMWLYAIVTGLNPPALRAALMSTLVLLGLLLYHAPHALNTLWFSALVALLWDSFTLFAPSTHLSYAVLFAILFTSKWWLRRYELISYTDPFLPRRLFTRWQSFSLRCRRYLRNSLAVSSSAYLGSAPLTWLYFGIITPISILASLPLIALVFCILALGSLSICGFALYPPFASMLNQANAQLATLTHQTAAQFASIPFTHYRRQTWGSGERIVIYHLKKGGAACYLGIGGGTLLDVGSASSFPKQILPSLLKNGARVDSLIATHHDTQHVGGAALAAATFPLKQTIVPPSLLSLHQQLNKSGCHLHHPSSGTYPLTAESHLEFFCPADTSSPELAQYAADDACSLILLHWQNKRILFQNDAGFAFEQELAEQTTPQQLHADILVLGKHAKDFSATIDHIRRISPNIIIASHGNFPQSETRSAMWQEQIRALGIRLLLLNESGAVTLHLENGDLRLSTFLDDKAH